LESTVLISFKAVFLLQNFLSVCKRLCHLESWPIRSIRVRVSGQKMRGALFLGLFFFDWMFFLPWETKTNRFKKIKAIAFFFLKLSVRSGD